jgi:hypothetical protein
MIQHAAMLKLNISRKKLAMLSISVLNYAPYFVKLIVGEVLMSCKRRDECRQRALEAFFKKLVEIGKLNVVLGNERADGGVVLHQHPPFGKTLYYRIGSGA